MYKTLALTDKKYRFVRELEATLNQNFSLEKYRKNQDGIAGNALMHEITVPKAMEIYKEYVNEFVDGIDTASKYYQRLVTDCSYYMFLQETPKTYSFWIMAHSVLGVNDDQH